MKKSTPESSKKQDEQPTERGGGVFGSLTGFLESMGRLAGAAESRSGPQTKTSAGAARESGDAPAKTPAEERVGGILNGLAELAEKLNAIAEKGESKSTQGEFTFPSKEGGIKGVYGFSVKMGLGEKGDHIRVEPFGNIRKDKKTGEAVVQEIHEPLVDVFTDESATTLVAEMPGVGPEDIHLEVQDDVLTITAQKGDKKYRKEVLLGHVLATERISVTCNNGIVTIRCGKAGK